MGNATRCQRFSRLIAVQPIRQSVVSVLKQPVDNYCGLFFIVINKAQQILDFRSCENKPLEQPKTPRQPRRGVFVLGT